VATLDDSKHSPRDLMFEIPYAGFRLFDISDNSVEREREKITIFLNDNMDLFGERL